MNDRLDNLSDPAMAPTDWLCAHRRRVEMQRNALRATESRRTWARLLLFAAAVLIWVPLGSRPVAAGVPCVVLLAAFGQAVRLHRRARRARELADGTLAVIDESLRRSAGQVTLIRSGERPREAPGGLAPILTPGRTAALTDQERDDLDLYAPPVGLFGLLNRTSSILGARRLADMLENPSLENEHIGARQATIRHLADRPAERFRLLAAAAALRSQDTALDRLVAALHGATPLPHPLLTRFLQIWGAVTGVCIASLIVAVGFGSVQLLIPIAVWWSANAMVFLGMRRGLRSRVEPWRNLGPALSGTAGLVGQTLADLPDDGEPARLRACFERAACPDALPSLWARVAWADTGGVFHAIVNTLLFYDLHVAVAILAVAVRRRDDLLAALSAAADLEALLSLACFAWEQPGTCWPDARPDSGLTITAGTHPLIEPDRAVPNDISLTPQTRVWVVTGSNMAGKSTLLRVAGTNLLLAQMGSVVSAKGMVFSPLRLLTDLRARDDLARKESYFLAEVRQLRRMVCPPADPARLLGLIDEPFRGTNSDEQVAAALAVLRHLLDAGEYYIVATHERRLTELADGRGARNVHFTENLDAGGLTFDYRLRPGPATTRNAIRILERENFPPELIQRARQHLPGAADCNPGSARKQGLDG